MVGGRGDKQSLALAGDAAECASEETSAILEEMQVDIQHGRCGR